jgi:MinD-like ATPase involved in chromosome partitioning or flagellar assembly
MRSPRYLVFYSYRGGVGRTMALCNVAARMAEAGDRVLVIDFDLEAPGASVLLGEGKASEREGLLECLQAFRDTDTLPPLDRYVHLVTAGTAPLRLLPAGKLDGGYPRKVGDLDWVRDFTGPSGIGERFFQSLKESIDTIDPPLHYVLVDSRPGVSPTSALAVDLLADEAVLVCGLNRQSFAGLRWARARFESIGRAVHCVISPAPRSDGYEDERKALRSALKLEPVAELPFDEDLLWRERLLLTSQDRARPLAQRYDELTDALRSPDDVYQLVTRALSDLKTPGRATPARVNLERARHKDPNDARVLRALAHMKVISGDDAAACEYVEKAAAVSARDPDLWKIIDDLYDKHKDEAGPLRARLELLYADHAISAPTLDQRRLLAWFSVNIRAAVEAEGREVQIRRVLDELNKKAEHVTPPKPQWRELAERLPIRGRAAEGRNELRRWQDRCGESGLPELVAVLGDIGDDLKLYRDVSGVVDQFFSAGYGFLMSDDGERGIHFTRTDCKGYGRAPGEFIPRGEVAVFNIVQSDHPDHPWRAESVRFPQVIDQDKS